MLLKSNDMSVSFKTQDLKCYWIINDWLCRNTFWWYEKGKYHVTLKTGIMATKKSALPAQEKKTLDNIFWNGKYCFNNTCILKAIIWTKECFFHDLNTYLYAISELSLLSLKVKCTVEVKIWHELCNIFKILSILPKKEGSYKMPYLFILVLTWIRYFKWKMFTYSPKEKIIIEFIKMIPFKSTWLIINTLAYLNPLQQWLYDFGSIFSHRGQLQILQ